MNKININNENIIIGEININESDINKDIQIINSFENSIRVIYMIMGAWKDIPKNCSIKNLASLGLHSLTLTGYCSFFS